MIECVKINLNINLYKIEIQFYGHHKIDIESLRYREIFTNSRVPLLSIAEDIYITPKHKNKNRYGRTFFCHTTV